VPARLATGYVPGDWDPITSSYRVRESDAHAWTEVWFPTFGWVPFDPTADVPLSGDAPTHPEVSWIWEHLSLLLVIVAAATSIVRPAARLIRASWRWARRSIAERRKRKRSGWVAEAERRFDRLAGTEDEPRSPHETATMFGARVSSRRRDPRPAELGALIDRAVYAPDGATEADRGEIERRIEEVGASR